MLKVLCLLIILAFAIKSVHYHVMTYEEHTPYSLGDRQICNNL